MVYAYERESVVIDGRLSQVRWKWGKRDRFGTEYLSVLDCDELQLANLTRADYEFELNNQEVRSAEVDLTAATIPSFYRGERAMFADSHEGARLVLNEFCPKVDGGWSERWARAAPESKCKPPLVGLELRLCTEDRRFATAFRLLTTRGVRVVEACGDSKADVLRIIRFAIEEADACKTSNCADEVLESQVRFFSQDLTNRLAGEACRSVLVGIERIERAEDAAKGTLKLRDYVVCATAAIPRLDDGVSAVETVVSGLHSRCSDKFAEATSLLRLHGASVEPLRRTLNAKLTELVLTYRANFRRSGAPKPMPPSGSPAPRLTL